MVNVDDLKAFVEECDFEVLLMDGFDDCIIGLVGGDEAKVVYSEEMVIAKLTEELGDAESALDWYGYNISSCYLGVHTPLIIQTEFY